MGIYQTKLRSTVSYEDEYGKHVLSEGDKVICVAGGIKYTGTILSVGVCKEENGESYNAMSIYNPVSEDSYFVEVIRIDNIKRICKDTSEEDAEIAVLTEAQDRRIFNNMLTGLGYDANEYASMYDEIKDCAGSFYELPIEEILACAVNTIRKQCEISESLKDICGIDVAATDKLVDMCMGHAKIMAVDFTESCEKIIDAYEEVLKKGEKRLPKRSDVLNFITDQYNDYIDDDKIDSLDKRLSKYF